MFDDFRYFQYICTGPYLVFWLLSLSKNFKFSLLYHPCGKGFLQDETILLAALRNRSNVVRKVHAHTLLPRPDKQQINRPFVLCMTKHQSDSAPRAKFPVSKTIPLVFDMYGHFGYSQYVRLRNSWFSDKASQKNGQRNR
jgi:hypothetical protein